MVTCNGAKWNGVKTQENEVERDWVADSSTTPDEWPEKAFRGSDTLLRST